MEKLTFNNEQLEFLKFIVQDFEYNDDHERYMICLLYTSDAADD